MSVTEQMLEQDLVSECLAKEVTIEELSVGDFVLVGANETGGKSHKHYVCTIEKVNENSVDVLFMVCKGNNNKNENNLVNCVIIR